MTSKKEKLILIDGNALLYRSFYALPPLTTKDGIPTGGVYGFTRILLKLLREEKPDYLACAFDKGKKTFRHLKWEEYKATRPKTPPALSQQAPLIKEILTGFNVPIFEEEEYEADDLLATLAKKGEKAGFKVEIFTGDKDILQIVSPSISIVRFKKGISQTEIFDPQKVEKEYGIFPDQIADYLALVGDVSDNIPGVPGIGPATATRLIRKFGNLEEILINLDKLPVKIAQKIKENIEQVKLSKKLATIIYQVPLEFDLEKLKVRPPDESKLLDIFTKLEFKELIKEINSPNSHLKNNKKVKSVSTPNLEDLIEHPPEGSLFIWLEKEDKEWKITLSFGRGVVNQINLGREPAQNPFIEKLSRIFKSENPGKVGHNLKNTLVKLSRWGCECKGIEFDTAIAAYLLNSSSPDYSLNDLSIRYLGRVMSDEKNSLTKINTLKELYPVLKEQIDDKKVKKLFYEVEIPLIEVLAQMELRGIKVDVKTLKDLLQQVRKCRKGIEEEIYREVGEEFNLNSPQQLGKVLFEKLNLPVIKRTRTGYSTNEEVLQALLPLCPSLKKILEYRHLFKLESSYIEPLLKLIEPHSGRIHTCFNQILTATGRLSSSQPNLQNIPIREETGADIRKAFVAEEGYLFVSADYSQIELRILAHLSQDEHLKSAFLKGEDIHRETAAEIFNCLPLQVTAPMRRLAKVVNFGIIYGISPFGLARDLGISEKEAEEYIERYFNRYPGVKKYIDKTLERARQKGYVETLLGRRRYLPQINSRNKRKRRFAERTAINSPIQGTAADLIKLAMVNLYRRLKKEKLPAWIILQIHDELLLEVSQEKIGEVRKIVKEEMEKAMKLSVPLVVDTRVGQNWAEMKA